MNSVIFLQQLSGARQAKIYKSKSAELELRCTMMVTLRERTGFRELSMRPIGESPRTSLIQYFEAERPHLHIISDGCSDP